MTHGGGFRVCVNQGGDPWFESGRGFVVRIRWGGVPGGANQGGGGSRCESSGYGVHQGGMTL